MEEGYMQQVSAVLKKQLALTFAVEDPLADFLLYIHDMLQDGHSAVDIDIFLRSHYPDLDAQTFKQDLENSHLLQQGILYKQGSICYPYRLYYYEQLTAKYLTDLALTKKQSAFDLGSWLVKHCPSLPLSKQQQQALSAINRRQLFLINGGPGHGKSYLLSTLLVAIAGASAKLGYPQVLVATATAKAAIRLQSMFQSMLAKVINLEEFKKVAANIDKSAFSFSTIHNCLQINPHSFFTKFNPQNPLLVDWLIIDEASMLSLEMYYSVLQAVDKDIQLVLSGDSKQLPAVQGGGCFQKIEQALAASPVQNKVYINLTENFRQRHMPAASSDDAQQLQIQSLLKYVLEKDSKSFFNCLTADIFESNLDIAWPQIHSFLLAKGQKLKNGSKQEALLNLESSILLSFARRGRYGCDQINHEIVKNLYPYANYQGLPFIIKENNPLINVSNGDIGVFWYQQNKERAFLAQPETSDPQQQLGLDRQQLTFNPFFAITVHESQGSEFSEVYLLLAEPGSPLNCRELLYTAISRAKNKLKIFGKKQALQECLQNDLQKYSGLDKAIVAKLTSAL